MNTVDTNVLVYFVDRDEPAKRAKAVALLDRLGERSPQPRSLCATRPSRRH